MTSGGTSWVLLQNSQKDPKRVYPVCMYMGWYRRDGKYQGQGDGNVQNIKSYVGCLDVACVYENPQASLAEMSTSQPWSIPNRKLGSCLEHWFLFFHWRITWRINISFKEQNCCKNQGWILLIIRLLLIKCSAIQIPWHKQAMWTDCKPALGERVLQTWTQMPLQLFNKIFSSLQS